MRTPQLMTGVLAAAVLTVATACNRADTQQQTRQAAADVKTAAAEAGDRIADGWLTTKIQARFFADDQVKARYIDVATKDGVVTIKGFVESPAARERALQIARTTDGVKQVNDQLLIGQSPKAFEQNEHPVATSGSVGSAASSAAAKLDDGRITSSIQAKYFLDSRVKGRRIDVDTHSGVVTLKGEVASDDERGQALRLARTTDGVERVEDNLTVNAAIDQLPAAGDASTVGNAGDAAGTAAATIKEGVEDVAVTTKVKAKFVADSQIKASSIDVSTKDGVVLLQGTVPSAAAKQRALNIAKQTDGVVQVVDRLSISGRSKSRR